MQTSLYTLCQGLIRHGSADNLHVTSLLKFSWPRPRRNFSPICIRNTNTVGLTWLLQFSLKLYGDMRGSPRAQSSSTTLPLPQSYSSVIWSHNPTNTEALEICPRTDLPWGQWKLSFRPHLYTSHEFWGSPEIIECSRWSKKPGGKMEHFWENTSKELRSKGPISPRL